MDSIVYNDYFPLPTVVYHCLGSQLNRIRLVLREQSGQDSLGLLP